MMLRGRLIFPMWVVIARLDTEATAAGNGGAGYHPVFREPVPSTTNAGTTKAKRTDTRRYTTVMLKAQVNRGQHQQLRQGPGGNVPDSRLELILLASDLEQRGLIGPTGEPALKVNDKLVGIYGSCGRAETVIGELKQTADIRDLPGYFCVEVRPGGEGLGGDRNLVSMFFEDREHGKAA